MGRFIWGFGVLLALGCDSSGGLSDPAPAPPDPTLQLGKDGSEEGGAPAFGFSQPPLPGPTFTAPQAPPPIAGGTLLISKDQKTAIVADPDRDQVLVVDLAAMAVTQTLKLEAKAEPGRAVQDADGLVHLLLRGSGKLLTFDPASGEVLGTRSVCSYPRGVAVADSEHAVFVACAEGKLVTLSTDATETTPLRTLTLDRDLRDVVVTATGLWVSRFRAAEVLKLDATGQVVARVTPPVHNGKLGESTPGVAWRMLAYSGGGVVLVHQLEFAGEVAPFPGGYGDSGAPGGIVQTAVTTVGDDGHVLSSSVALSAPLPVDMAESAYGKFLLASAAIPHPTQAALSLRTLLVDPNELGFSATPQDGGVLLQDPTDPATQLQRGQIVAVGFAGDIPVMQYRDPNSLVVGSRGLALPGDSVQDTGTTLFHLETGSGLACASCHPEGREDGHVWNFAKLGPRRTQSLLGGISGTEPFHWDGAETDFATLTNDVMQGRMGGPELSADQNAALMHYIDGFAAMPAPGTDVSPAIERGKTLFNDASVGCATCHSGARFSNEQSVNVNSKDGLLQVPGLVGLWSRAPFLHDGCAQTLLDRFTTCDTGQHGNLKGLTQDDFAALSAYLETL